MTFPIVTGLPPKLEPLSRDTFGEPASRDQAVVVAPGSRRRIVD